MVSSLDQVVLSLIPCFKIEQQFSGKEDAQPVLGLEFASTRTEAWMPAV